MRGTKPEELQRAVRNALEELEIQRARLQEIRDLTFGKKPPTITVDDLAENGALASGPFVEKVFDRTVDLTLARLTLVIDRLKEALESGRDLSLAG